MSVQRKRHGVSAWLFPSHMVTDRRGNRQRTTDLNAEPFFERAAYIPQRSAKAEVPGQQQINVVRIIISHDLPDIDLYSRVWMRGRWWDVVTPPAYHHGTRRTRHWSIDVRERPS